MAVTEQQRQLVLQSSRAVLAGAVEPKEDAARERRRATFDSQQLAEVLNGGAERLQRIAELAAKLAATPWGDKSRRYFLTREQEYVGALQAAVGIWDGIRDKSLSMEDAMEARKLVNFPGGLELHIGMFVPTLLAQATAEQQAVWLPQALSLRLIGTYAQTELGHGTFVRGLQTTATYDPASDAFLLHSPALSATKWWPGGLGKTATHAVVMAQLFTGGRNHGPHSFVVQLRDLRTHLPLAGIDIGDIGPKMGYNGVDNGFLRFDHVLVPRDQMLMKYARVERGGRYQPPPPANQKASFSSMVYVRATIVEEAGLMLARSVTIAVRYCVVRRQTAPQLGEPELQVLDYQNTAAELLPLVAASYALIFMGKAAMRMYQDFEAARDKGSFEGLPELHATLAGMKALSTNIASDGMEACRRACGGHGYSLLSGLPTIFTSYVQNVTWEGDNNVMLLQTARYLIKGLLAAEGAAPMAAGSLAYLSSCQEELHARSPAGSPEALLAAEALIACFRHRAARLCTYARGVLARKCGSAQRLAFEGPAWNGSTVDLIRLAKAHCQLILVQTFAATLGQHAEEGTLPPATLGVLEQLLQLFAVSALLREAGDFLEDGYLSGEQVGWLREAQAALLLALRPNAVALVDAFGLTDYLLNSALGRRDGDIYRALLEAAKASPLNATQEGPAWPLLKPHLARAAKGQAGDAGSQLMAKL